MEGLGPRLGGPGVSFGHLTDDLRFAGLPGLLQLQGQPHTLATLQQQQAQNQQQPGHMLLPAPLSAGGLSLFSSPYGTVGGIPGDGVPGSSRDHAHMLQSNGLSPALLQQTMVGRGTPALSEEPGHSGPSGKSSSAYASRHQAAEQRRRTRINERLDLLRKLVPHSDRANTASFLEEVLKYIDTLKTRVAELEATLAAIKSGRAVAGMPPVAAAVTPLPPHAASPPASSAPMRADGLGAGGLPPSQQQELLASMQGQGSMGGGLSQLQQHQLQQLQQQQLQQQQQQQQQQLMLGQGQSHGGQGLNVGLLQQLQQQQLQQLLQQQHEQAVMALHAEQQQQKAAMLAAHQMRQQQEQAAARQATQLADLATQLGLKSLPGVSPGHPASSGHKQEVAAADTLSSLAKDVPRATASAGEAAANMAAGGDPRSSAASIPSAATALNILPIQSLQLSAAAAAAAGNGAVAAPAQAASSPVSSEESGMPPKKRKVLVL